jgi:flagellar basal body-associated protein FliL
MRYRVILLFVSALILNASFASFAFAQSSQSYTVNLIFSTIQVSYPPYAMPGDTITLNVQVTPKSNVYLQSLTATVYYADETGLHQLVSQTLTGSTGTNTNSYYYSSPYNLGVFSKSIQFNVPSNAPRTSLLAVFSETAQSGYGAYAYSPFYGCGVYFCSYYSYPSYYSNYSPYTYGSVSDSGIAPLSYVKAGSPEYAALQTQYQALEQQLNQTETQNRQLRSTIGEQSATINQLNQQLTAVNGSVEIYQFAVLGLGILVIVLAALMVFRGGKASKPAEQETSVPKDPAQSS